MKIIRLLVCCAILIASSVSVQASYCLDKGTALENGVSIGELILPKDNSPTDDFDDLLIFLYPFQCISINLADYSYVTPTSILSSASTYAIRAPPIFPN